MTIFAIFAAVLLMLFCITQNNKIVITEHVYPKNSDNELCIVHISDLHNKRFGKGQTRLIRKIKECRPDVIFVTGDIIDSRDYRPDIAEEFLKEAKKLAPVYFCSGNHEGRCGRYKEICDMVKNSGATVTDGKTLSVTLNDAPVSLCGVADAIHSDDESIPKRGAEFPKGNVLKILLAHRPELLEEYAKSGADLVFSGHAHGGQIRLPWIGGLYVPGQGIFPKYDSGKYACENTTMYISRGLGNSGFPQRIFNYPEIIKVLIK